MLMSLRLSTAQVLFMLLEQETFMVLGLQIIRDGITVVVVHRHDNVWVFAELNSCALQRVEKFVSEFRLPLKHVWVLIEVFLSKLDNVVFLQDLLVLRSHVIGSLVGPVDLFLCNTSSDAIIFKHSRDSNVSYFRIHLSERPVSLFDPCIYKTLSPNSTFHFFSLMLTILVDILDRVG